MPQNFLTNLSVVKDVDLEAMPTSIFLDDDDDDDLFVSTEYMNVTGRRTPNSQQFNSFV